MSYLIVLSLLVGCALSFPINDLGLNDGYDNFNCYFGPCNYGMPVGGLIGYRGPIAYRFPPYQRTIDFARENYVRGSDFRATEVGTRDEVSIRAPFARLYSSYFPQSYLGDVGKLPLNPYNYGYDASIDLNSQVVGDMLYQWK